MKNFAVVLNICTLRLDITIMAESDDEIYAAFDCLDDDIAQYGNLSDEYIKTCVEDILAEEFGACVEENGGVWSRDEKSASRCNFYVEINPA